jgi:hypothetical protein
MTFRKTLLALGILVASAASADTPLPCTDEGAFGLTFGSKPPRRATKLYDSGSAIWYEIVPPRPDTRFDRCEIRVDRKANEIYEVVGITSILPRPRTTAEAERITREQKTEAAAKADALALQYLEALPPEMRSVMKQSSLGGASWEGHVTEGLHLDISSDIHWGVRVGCRDAQREETFGRRALKEWLKK